MVVRYDKMLKTDIRNFHLQHDRIIMEIESGRINLFKKMENRQWAVCQMLMYVDIFQTLGG